MLFPSSYNTFVDPGFALIPGRNPGLQDARLNQVQSIDFALQPLLWRIGRRSLAV
jgi:hypothetical protein